MPRNIFQQLVPHKEMKFAPVEEDDDELSEFIKSDPLAHDNEWNLKEPVNAQQLDAFWSDAVKDLGPLEVEREN